MLDPARVDAVARAGCVGAWATVMIAIMNARANIGVRELDISATRQRESGTPSNPRVDQELE
jgi:hypothetical protein